MKQSLSTEKLVHYVDQQLQHFFPDGNHHSDEIKSLLANTLERLNYCFSHINRKYYQQEINGQMYTQFNHLNSDHYASFLYLLSNEAWRDDAIILAEKLFYLNKALNGLDCFYSIKLPEIFMFVHPVGTVLGNAEYQNYFVVYQGVTVGSTLNGKYPVFNEGCVLYEKSSVIGCCRLGKNITIAAGALVINQQIDENITVFEQSPRLQMRATNIDVIVDVFGIETNNKKALDK